MFFIGILIIWGVYVLVLKNRTKVKFSMTKALFPLVLLSIISSVALGVNYATSAIPNSEGIAITNFLSYWIIGEDGWSVALFKRYFNLSLIVSILLLGIHSGLTLIERD